MPQRTVLVIYQHQKSHMGATKASFQRLEQVRNRQQLLCGIHLRHVGGFDFVAGILNHKLYALQERKPWNLTKPSNGANENEVFLGMAGKWDARIYCPRFWVSRRFSRCLFFVMGEVEAMQWVGPEYSKHEENWDSMDSNLLYLHVLVSCQAASPGDKKRSFRRSIVFFTWLCKWFAQSDEPTHAAPQLSMLFHTFHASSSSKSWCQWEPPHDIGKMRVPQWRVNGISIWKKSCIVMQQRHCNWTHSQVWFGTKMITLLLAKWFMRLRNISKIFKVSSKSVSTKRVTSKGQTLTIRGQKWKLYGPHSTMILFRLIASTLIFVWVIRYSHLSCSKSRLRTLSSSSRKDRLLHGIQAIAMLVLPRLSRKYQGQSRVFERSEGHVLKSLSFRLFVARIRDQGMLHEQL